MVNEYKDRLQAAMDEAKTSKAQLARDLKISYQAVVKALAGGQFGSENNIKAAKLLGVRSEWLATGKGPMVDEEKRLAPEVAELAVAINQLPKRQRDIVLMSIRNSVDLVQALQDDGVIGQGSAGTSEHTDLQPVRRLAR